MNASNEKTAEKKVKLAAELEVERLKAQSQADKARVQAAEAKEKQAKDDLIREKAKANAELEATKAKVQAAEAEKEKIMAELEAEKAKLKAEAGKKAKPHSPESHSSTCRGEALNKIRQLASSHSLARVLCSSISPRGRKSRLKSPAQSVSEGKSASS